MWIKKSNPVTPGRRNYSTVTFEEITTSKPEKTLIKNLKSRSWRNNFWRITVRRRWWGHKRLYRMIDFRQVANLWVEAIVKEIEYDPNRTAFIALIYYKNWEKSYILSPQWLKVWDTVICDDKAELKPWNRMKIVNVPVWYNIYNLEVIAWKWWQLVKTAWSSAKLMSLDWEKAQVQLPSWEVRYFSKDSYVSIWVLSNQDHSLVRIWKAWRQRWLWKRPQVLGKSMNACDHPHGGWEWHSPIGLKNPKTPWWMPALGFKTRKRNKTTNKDIAVSRHRRKKK